MNKQNIEKFSEVFVKELGKFVDNQKRIAKIKGISEAEYKAIISTTFKLLGKNAKFFQKQAKL